MAIGLACNCLAVEVIIQLRRQHAVRQRLLQLVDQTVLRENIPRITSGKQLIQCVLLDDHARPPSASLWPRTQNLGHSLLTAGQRHDSLAANALLEGFRAEAVLADRAYDNNDLRQTIAGMDAEAVIPSTRSRKVAIPYDKATYRLRNHVERCFNKLKHFRRFATRYDRRAEYFLAFVHLAAITLWLR